MGSIALPIIRGSSPAIYPFTQTISFLTDIAQWQNASQQRTIKRPSPLVKFSIPYTALSQAQKNTVLAAVSSAKGRFSNSITLFLGTTTYTNLQLDDDEWSATESHTMQYDGPMKLTQTITQNWFPGTPGTAFPTLANGAIGILPYSQKKRYQTVSQSVPAGPTYNFAEYSSGLSGYPTDGLHSWIFGMRDINDADLSTLVAHFVANFGAALGFQFTDEDSTVYSNVHYKRDDMVINYKGPNQSDAMIEIEQTF